jgi:hypothetical protein
LAGQSGGALLTVDGVDESHNYLYEQDPDIKAVVDEYDQAFEVLRSTVIGHSDIFLNGERQAVRSGRPTWVICLPMLCWRNRRPMGPRRQLSMGEASGLPSERGI